MFKFILSLLLFIQITGCTAQEKKENKRPNILYIMADDHTSQAIGAYGSRLAALNPTPNIDRLAKEGIIFENAFCTNSICTPSRACILTGQYSQTNGVLDLTGLGGEHDATAVFPKVLTLVTPIDIDHEAFLGSTIKAIATTKLKAVQKHAVIAAQKHKQVYEVAQDLEEEYGISIKGLETYIQEKDRKKIKTITHNNKLVPYLVQNLCLAISALKFLNIEYKVEDFNNAKLYGRLTQVSENILLDVGHNTLAAKAIVDSLKECKYTLVYNSYKDKNYEEILRVLKPIINDVEIINIKDERKVSVKVLQKVLDDMSIKHSHFKHINRSKKYLVFGSFSVAEAFLKVMNG